MSPRASIAAGWSSDDGVAAADLICSRTYALFFHRFPVVPEPGFWHNHRMPNCAEKNAVLPDAVLPTAPPNPAPGPAAVEPRPSDDRAVSEGIPSGEIGGPSGPEPTRFGDWEKKGRCIDF
jgi:hypothetical protein